MKDDYTMNENTIYERKKTDTGTGVQMSKKNYITIALLRRAITSLFILYDIQASISGFHFLEMPSFTFIVTPAFFVAISFQIYAFCQHNFSAFTDLY